MEAFIDRAALQCHGDGRGLVIAGVVVLAVVENGHWNQASLAVRKQLNQAQGSRSLKRFFRGRGLDGKK